MPSRRTYIRTSAGRIYGEAVVFVRCCERRGLMVCGTANGMFCATHNAASALLRIRIGG